MERSSAGSCSGVVSFPKIFQAAMIRPSRKGDPPHTACGSVASGVDADQGTTRAGGRTAPSDRRRQCCHTMWNAGRRCKLGGTRRKAPQREVVAGLHLYDGGCEAQHSWTTKRHSEGGLGMRIG